MNIIIRKNKNGIAVLDGSETQDDMTNLGKDMLQYYGLGCRNVSKLYLPKGFDLNMIFGGLFPYANIIEMNKYANNYDYNKAVYLMSEYDLIENGFLILKEDTNYASPIATLFYEFYEDLESLKLRIKADASQIQCLVSKNFSENEVTFGATQLPKLSDFADGIDTVDFLLKI